MKKAGLKLSDGIAEAVKSFEESVIMKNVSSFTSITGNADSEDLAGFISSVISRCDGDCARPQHGDVQGICRVYRGGFRGSIWRLRGQGGSPAATGEAFGKSWQARWYRQRRRTQTCEGEPRVSFLIIDLDNADGPVLEKP
jgi:hypothetical protein